MRQVDKDIVSGIRDGLIKTLMTGSMLGTALIAPNAILILDKPIEKYLQTLDKNKRDRLLRRELYYLKRMGMIRISPDGYEHGISLTDKGKKKVHDILMDDLRISPQKKWDKKWRIVFYDIPENKKSRRDYLTRKLKDLGFVPLQRSVLVYPFSCLEEVASITEQCGISKYVSYIEAGHISNESALISRFSHLNLK